MKSTIDKNSLLILIVATILLVILTYVLFNIVLNVNSVSVCNTGSGNSFDCGGATVLQYQYEEGFLHTASFILVCGGIICSLILLFLAFKSRLHQGNIVMGTICLVIGIILLVINTIGIMNYLEYGNKPHLKGNQIVMNN